MKVTEIVESAAERRMREDDETTAGQLPICTLETVCAYRVRGGAAMLFSFNHFGQLSHYFVSLYRFLPRFSCNFVSVLRLHLCVSFAFHLCLVLLRCSFVCVQRKRNINFFCLILYITIATKHFIYSKFFFFYI